jgi:hypothetical protein
MKAHHLRRDSLAIVVWGVLVLGSAGAVGAQSAGQAEPAPEASSFDELKSRLQPGANLLVTDSAGREVSGKLSGLSDTSLRLVLHGQPQAFTQADVALVKQRRRDSLWNGFLIGMAAGAAPAVYWLFADPNECGESICMDDLLIGVIPGAAIGLGIDAAIQRKVIVYRRPLTSLTRMGLTVAPIVAGRRRGVDLTISF